MKTWYKMTSYGDPTPVEVVSESAKFVTVKLTNGNESRAAKNGDLESYFTSIGACWAWRIAVYVARVDIAKARLASEEEALADLHAHVAEVKGLS